LTSEKIKQSPIVVQGSCHVTVHCSPGEHTTQPAESDWQLGEKDKVCLPSILLPQITLQLAFFAPPPSLSLKKLSPAVASVSLGKRGERTLRGSTEAPF
jgi:hypothetical protein